MKKLLHASIFLLLNLFFVNSSIAQAGLWTWIKGDSVPNSIGVYGIKGVPSPTNKPPGLYEACEWTDLQGNFWLYGGYNSQGFMAALWKYDPASNNWTWISGFNTPNHIPVYGTIGVPGSANNPGSRSAGVNTWTDSNNNLWLFGGGISVAGIANNDLWKYNITSNEWTWIKGSNVSNAPGVYGIKGVPSLTNTPPATNECSASWIDSIGNLWFFGGSNGFASFNDLWRYNIVSNEWTWMKGSGGSFQNPVYGIQGISNPTNSPGSRLAYCKWTDQLGNFWLFGGAQSLSWILFNDVWKYEPTSNNWTWMAGTSLINDTGNYSPLCISGNSYSPPSRYENRACWNDSCSGIWMFGGVRDQSFSVMLGDLWHFNITANEFSFIKGFSITNQSGNHGTLGIPSINNLPDCRGGSNAWSDFFGNLYLFGGATSTINYYNDLWRYTPNTNCFGCSNSVLAPIINLQSSDTNFCEKQCINFFDLSTNNPTSWQWYFPGAVPDTSTQQNPTNICYNNFGSFDVTLIACNSAGCDTLTIPNFINEFQNPVDSIYQSNDTLYSLPAFSYQWFEVAGGIISGATNQFYVPQQQGSYYCVIADSIGCIATSNIIVVTASWQLAMGSWQFSIQPNPTSENLQIQFQNNFNDDVEVEISNVLGENILMKKFSLTKNSKNISVDVSNFNDGIYFITIRSKQFLVYKKFIVKN